MQKHEMKHVDLWCAILFSLKISISGRLKRSSLSRWWSLSGIAFFIYNTLLTIIISSLSTSEEKRKKMKKTHKATSKAARDPNTTLVIEKISSNFLGYFQKQYQNSWS